MTKYVVLRATEEGTWEEIDPVSASSAEAAIRQARKATFSDQEFEIGFVAIPERSWKPVVPEVVLREVVKLRPATKVNVGAFKVS